jgi:hypothetical protein
MSDKTPRPAAAAAAGAAAEHPGAAGDWGVLIDELGIFACTAGAGAWTEFWIRCHPRWLTLLAMSPSGGHWHVLGESKEDAAGIREMFLEKGIHPKHVKVARLSRCREAAERRQARQAAAALTAPHPGLPSPVPVSGHRGATSSCPPKSPGHSGGNLTLPPEPPERSN